MRSKLNNRAQSIMEYFIIFTVVLAAVLAGNFIGRTQGAFRGYFDSAIGAINP